MQKNGKTNLSHFPAFQSIKGCDCVFVWIQVLLFKLCPKALAPSDGGWGVLSGAVNPRSVTPDSMRLHGGPAQQWRHSPILTGKASEFQIFNSLCVHTFTRLYKHTHTFIQQILTEHVLCPNHFLGMIRIQQLTRC